MTLVFEARRLPFDDTDGSRLGELQKMLSEEDFASLTESRDGESETYMPLRELDILAAVMPVVLESRGVEERTGAGNVSAEALAIALKIVKELDELDSIYYGIKIAKRNVRDNPMFPGDENIDPDDDTDIDIAMCFSSTGVMLGVGSAGVFGGHGYHPDEAAPEGGNDDDDDC